MNLLVTGGTGFLGSYFVRYALNHAGLDHVFVFERYVDRSRLADCLDRVTIIEGDISEQGQVEDVIRRHGIDHIAHFAFILGSPAPGMMQDYVKVQMLGTANVLEAARQADVKRVMFASSVAAYGQQQTDLLREELVPNPAEPYGAAKVWCESTMRHYREAWGLETVSVRFGSTYGLGRAWRGSYASGLLNVPQTLHYMARVEDAVRGKRVTMPQGNVLADFTYAGDAAKAGWLALSAKSLPCHIYNVASCRLLVADYTAAMRRALPDAEIIERQDEMPGNAHSPMDGTRLISDFGFQPDYTLDDGLADYVERIKIRDRYVTDHPHG